jgi:hypothetical protein
MFPLCVLVCFGLEGCVLVPRSSGTTVATWAWPTWVVSQRRVLEAVFVLLESSSPLRSIFIGSIHSPLTGSPYRSFKNSKLAYKIATFTQYYAETISEAFERFNEYPFCLGKQ